MYCFVLLYYPIISSFDCRRHLFWSLCWSFWITLVLQTFHGRGHDLIVIVFTPTCATNSYHDLSCQFYSYRDNLSVRFLPWQVVSSILTMTSCKFVFYRDKLSVRFLPWQVVSSFSAVTSCQFVFYRDKWSVRYPVTLRCATWQVVISICTVTNC